MKTTQTLAVLLVAVTVSGCNVEDMMSPVALFAVVPWPTGNPVAVDDTVTTWPNWMVPVFVLANDTGLVEVTSATATTGGAVPYHHAFVNYTPVRVGTDIVTYDATDSARTVSKRAKLYVTVAPTPPATNLSLTTSTYTTPGLLHVILNAHTIGPVGIPATSLQSDPLPSGVYFRTTHNDRCAADIPVGRVSCIRPGIPVGLTRTDTLAFSAKGWVTLSFKLASPASDPVLADNRTSFTVYVP